MRFAREAGFQTRFVGYETTEADTVLRVAERANGWVLAKLEESPFYPEGGGQISDTRPGGDAVRARAGGGRVPSGRRPGAGARAGRGRDRRGGDARAQSWSATRAWPRCATTPPRTCCTRRCASGSATTCARRAPTWARTSCASTSRTASGLSPEDLAEVERLVGGWVASNHPVRAIETTRDEAERLGAMALFGEKYGDRVRMVEIEGVSRELCGGTHVSATSEIGLFHVTTETSSASNVRRIEAVTGPEAARLFQERTSA